jgi:uncharacterized glyoxalase superfamily protein PhnB
MSLQPREKNRMLVEAATILTVRDIAASIAHYRDVLGFAVTFQYGEPTFYAGLCRDDVSLHLRASKINTQWVPGNGAVAVFVTDVDALHQELAARGAKVLEPPQDYAYGMRDFIVTDPDGNQLTFGTEAKSRAA